MNQAKNLLSADSLDTSLPVGDDQFGLCMYLYIAGVIIIILKGYIILKRFCPGRFGYYRKVTDFLNINPMSETSL